MSMDHPVHLCFRVKLAKLEHLEGEASKKQPDLNRNGGGGAEEEKKK